MGNGISIDEAKYCFHDYNSHGINWFAKSVYIVDDYYMARKIQNSLQGCDTVFVDCEGENFGNPNAKIGIVQIAAASDCIVIFDVIRCPSIFCVIKELMEDASIVKVFHDCSGDAAALYEAGFNGLRGINVKNAFDVQTAQEIRDGGHSAYSLGDLYKRVVYKEFPKVNTKTFGSNKWLEKRPMSEDMVKYAAVDVMVLPEIYYAQICSMTSAQSRRCSTKTAERLTRKIKNLERTAFATRAQNSDQMYRSLPETHRSREQEQELASSVGTGMAVAAAIGIGLGALALLFAGNKNKK